MTAPTLTIGLPVYNGERYLSEALDALLAQTFTDFELVIADNASTDGTERICRAYAARDPRIRYVRHPRNIGAAPNHNFCVEQARGRYFKWASHDDLYAPELVERCISALEQRPGVVLAHAWDAFVDEHGAFSDPNPYELRTADPRPSVRLKSLLHVSGGNDVYGVIRREVLDRVGPMDSYHNADRTFVAALALEGPFHQVPEVLYFRRDHPQRAERSASRRIRSANLDPRRASRLRHPMARLYSEYVVGYLAAIARTPMSVRERVLCVLHVLGWLRVIAGPGAAQRRLDSNDPAVRARAEDELARRRARFHRKPDVERSAVGRTVRRLVVHAANLVSNVLGDDVVGRRLRRTVLRVLGAGIGAGSTLHGDTWFGEPERLHIGAGVFVNRSCYFDLEAPITLEDGVTIGHGTTLVTTRHETGPSTRRAGDYVGVPITVERGAWLGANVTVLPGVTVGRGAVVGAGSVVTHDVPADTCVAGVPAKVVKQLNLEDGSEAPRKPRRVN